MSIPIASDGSELVYVPADVLVTGHAGFRSAIISDVTAAVGCWNESGFDAGKPVVVVEVFPHGLR